MNYYKKNIKNVRGDTYSLGLTTDLELDTIFFTCRDSLNDNSSVLFQKGLGNGITLTEHTGNEYSYAIRIAPTDTDNIQAGTYYYDLQITINYDVLTIMKGKFIIEQDATRGDEPAEEEIVVQIKAVLDTINGETVSVNVFDKLDYLNTTKTLIKDDLNKLGAELTSSNTFRSYAAAIETIYDNYPRTTGEGTIFSLNTIKSNIDLVLKGNTEQDSMIIKNIFNKNDILTSRYINTEGNLEVNATYNASNYIEVIPNTIYTINAGGIVLGGSVCLAFYDTDYNFISYIQYLSNTVITFTTPSNSKYVRLSVNNASLSVFQLELGSTATSYVEYGTVTTPTPDYPENIKVVTGNNTIQISDGTNTQSYTISLGTIELCKIGDIQDVITKDDENWVIPNKILKIDSYNGQTITTDYISTTGELTTGATVYYVGENDLSITDETLITQLEALKDAYSYNGTTTISSEYSETNAQIIISATALMGSTTNNISLLNVIDINNESEEQIGEEELINE